MAEEEPAAAEEAEKAPTGKDLKMEKTVASRPSAEESPEQAREIDLRLLRGRLPVANSSIGATFEKASDAEGDKLCSTIRSGFFWLQAAPYQLHKQVLFCLELRSALKSSIGIIAASVSAPVLTIRRKKKNASTLMVCVVVLLVYEW